MLLTCALLLALGCSGPQPCEEAGGVIDWGGPSLQHTPQAALEVERDNASRSQVEKAAFQALIDDPQDPLPSSTIADLEVISHQDGFTATATIDVLPGDTYGVGQYGVTCS